MLIIKYAHHRLQQATSIIEGIIERKSTTKKMGPIFMKIIDRVGFLFFENLLLVACAWNLPKYFYLYK